MSLTADQITANRAQAVATVRAQLGLGNDLTAWTYDQRTAYNHALADYISSNPQLFSDQDILNANLVASTTIQPLEDDSFNWGDFAADAVAPITNAAESIGDGALTVANAAKWAIPLLAVVAVLVLAEKYSGGTAISSVKKVFQK